MTEKMIGQLNEHTLHLALKNYVDSDQTHHELEYNGYVCDVINESGITEIETRSFSNLSKKLGSLLEDKPVTVVFPITVKCSVIWIDGKTGELSEKRRSPKKGRASDVVGELYKIKEHLLDPNLKLRLIFLEEEHYKRRIGKRNGIREERVPVAFLSEMLIEDSNGYASLFDVIPDGDFTSDEFAKANKLRGRALWYALQLLLKVSVIEKTGQRGRAFIYRLKVPSA